MKNLTSALKDLGNVPFLDYPGSAKEGAQSTRSEFLGGRLHSLCERVNFPAGTKVGYTVVFDETPAANGKAWGNKNIIEFELPDGSRLSVTPTQSNNRSNRTATIITHTTFKATGRGKNRVMVPDVETQIAAAKWVAASKALEAFLNPPTEEQEAQDASEAAAEILEGAENILDGQEQPQEAEAGETVEA